MNKHEFFNLIRKDKYQVFLFSSPLPFPFNFAVHTWIVTAKKDKVTRWEVWDAIGLNKKSVGHVYVKELDRKPCPLGQGSSLSTRELLTITILCAENHL